MNFCSCPSVCTGPLEVPHRFLDDRSKIISMLTKLSDNAAKWAQPLKQQFQRLLEPERKKAQKALHTFKQSGNVESYTQQFNVHAYDSDWRDNILVSLYHAMQIGNKLEANRSHTFKISPPTHLITATDPNEMDLSAMNSRLWSYVLRLPEEEEPRPILQTHLPR
ncbi:uncharacterized protein VP01_1414g2 [Puccinia sorghi]|uniref:Retrotransposon gag domain-containing protein n=1 Tax=Puccinia sorghi TaxID=27349 RepID=A0A0L6VMM6_9BASI|nr:uncharacterized protein VP01_1414g2 [Puccinia sorghi]